MAVAEGVSLPSADGLDVTPTATTAAAERLVRSGEVDAAIVPSDDALGFRVVGLDSTPNGVVQALSVSPTSSSSTRTRCPRAWCTSSRWRSASCSSPRR